MAHHVFLGMRPTTQCRKQHADGDRCGKSTSTKVARAACERVAVVQRPQLLPQCRQQSSAILEGHLGTERSKGISAGSSLRNEQCSFKAILDRKPWAWSTVLWCRHARLVLMVGVTVRREKALDFSGCNSRPGTGSLHPVAIEAAVAVTKLSELSMERVARRPRERAGHNVSER
jgi:hypothetical protein